MISTTLLKQFGTGDLDVVAPTGDFTLKTTWSWGI